MVGCSFSREVWQLWFGRLHLQMLLADADQRAIEWWLLLRKQLPKTLRLGFDSLFFLIYWRLWKERNARTFDGAVPSAGSLASSIADEASLWIVAGNSRLALLFSAAGVSV